MPDTIEPRELSKDEVKAIAEQKALEIKRQGLLDAVKKAKAVFAAAHAALAKPGSDGKSFLDKLEDGTEDSDYGRDIDHLVGSLETASFELIQAQNEAVAKW